MDLFTKNKDQKEFDRIGHTITNDPMFARIDKAINPAGYRLLSAFVDGDKKLVVSISPYGDKEKPTIEIVNNKVRITTSGQSYMDPDKMKEITTYYINAYNVANYLQAKIDDGSLFKLAHI